MNGMTQAMNNSKDETHAIRDFPGWYDTKLITVASNVVSRPDVWPENGQQHDEAK